MNRGEGQHGEVGQHGSKDIGEKATIAQPPQHLMHWMQEGLFFSKKS
jgi:hypothetical protein